MCASSLPRLLRKQTGFFHKISAHA